MIASALYASPNLLYICLAVTRIKVEHHAGSITGLHDQVRFTSSPLHRHAREAKASKEVDCRCRDDGLQDWRRRRRGERGGRWVGGTGRRSVGVSGR